MNITTEEYNQVITGLGTQLKLQCQFNKDVMAERDEARSKIISAHREALDAALLRISQLGAIQNLAEGGKPLHTEHQDHTPAYAAVLKLVRGKTKNVRKK